MDLNLTNIFVVFDRNTPSETTALNSVNLTISQNDRITVLGNICSGKTSLLRLLAGYIQPTFGKIEAYGCEDTRLHANSFMISHDYEDVCHNELSVFEHAVLTMISRESGSIFKPVSSQDKLETVYEYINMYGFLDLADHLHVKAKNLTRPQICALSLLMAALKKPKLLLIDNMFCGLDSETSKKLTAIMKRIVKDSGITLVAIMDNPKTEFAFFNRCIIMSQGKVSFDVSGQSKDMLDFQKILDHFEVS